MIFFSLQNCDLTAVLTELVSEGLAHALRVASGGKVNSKLHGHLESFVTNAKPNSYASVATCFKDGVAEVPVCYHFSPWLTSWTPILKSF